MRPRHLLFLSLVVSSLLAAGCGRKPSSSVLATVGSQKITAEEFGRALRAMPEKNRFDPSADPEKRQSLLRDLINKSLLEQEAVARQPELAADQQRRLTRVSRSELLSAFMRKHVDDRIQVTDDEVRAIWERSANQIRARHILVQTEDEVREVQADLAKGVSFFDEAQKKSLDWKTGQNGGDLGWVSAGQMVEPFDKALFNLSPGQTSEPVKTQYGWHIIRADSMRAVPQQPFEGEKERIKVQLMQGRSMELQRQLMREVIEGAKPQNQQAGLELISRKFYMKPNPEDEGNPYAHLDQAREMPTFTPEELAVPVVKFANKPDFTVREFVDMLGWMAPGVWPRGEGTADVEDCLRQMLREKLYREQATAEGLDRSPEYLAIVKRKEMEMRVNQLYYRGILGKVELTDTDLRDYFEQHRQDYKVAERYQLARIQTVNQALAARAAELWRSGRTFEELEAIVRRDDPAAGIVARTMETPRGNEPPVDTLVYAGKPGDIIGPVLVPPSADGQQIRPAGWVVAQILDTRPERLMTYEEAEAYVKTNAKTEAADVELKKFLAEAEKKFPVKINQAAVDAISSEVLKEPPRR